MSLFYQHHRQDVLATLEEPSIPGGSVFSRSSVSDKPSINLEDVLEDDDYTGLCDILDDHDSDEGDLEREEERNIISRETYRSTADQYKPTWNFPSDLADGSIAPDLTLSSPVSDRQLDDISGCSLSPILASSVPPSPIFGSFDRAG